MRSSRLRLRLHELAEPVLEALFVVPRDGIHVLDRSTGQSIRFLGGWQLAEPPASPTGGTTTDAEARTAIIGLIDALRIAGVFATG